MKKYYISPKKFTKEEIKQYKKRRAKEDDCSVLINEECEIYNKDTGEKIIVMKKIPNLDKKKLKNYLVKTKFATTNRTWWILSTSRIFGYSPRIKMRNDYCTATALARDYPECHEYIVSLAEDINEIYKETLWEQREFHNQQTEKVLPEYRLQWSVFTSWIINKNNPLAYHHDAWNFSDVFSNMITLKEWIEGGRLFMPELDVKIDLVNGSVIMFDWQKILHWVSPIRKIHTKAYRYTIVFYSLKQMWQCLSYEEEKKRARSSKTDMYMKRKKILEEKLKNDT